jgi:hypothetical protein
VPRSRFFRDSRKNPEIDKLNIIKELIFFGGEVHGIRKNAENSKKWILKREKAGV